MVIESRSLRGLIADDAATILIMNMISKWPL